MTASTRREMNDETNLTITLMLLVVQVLAVAVSWYRSKVKQNNVKIEIKEASVTANSTIYADIILQSEFNIHCRPSKLSFFARNQYFPTHVIIGSILLLPYQMADGVYSTTCTHLLLVLMVLESEFTAPLLLYKE